MSAIRCGPPDYRDPDAVKCCVAFANEIGISASLAKSNWRTEFLPGILVWRGQLFINEHNIVGYGDILHELGHLAILPGAIRNHATGDIDQSIRRSADKYMRENSLIRDDHSEDQTARALLQCGDAEAIAWSFAAMQHLNLPIHIILANAPADDLAETLCMLGIGRYFGVHGLAAAGMTTTRTFPKMIRWAQP